jgi:hypothetical protein
MKSLRRCFALLAVALVPLLGTWLPAAPVPEILKEVWRKAPTPHCAQGPDCKCIKAGHTCNCGKADCDCVILNPYAHLPSKLDCQRNIMLSHEWANAILREARALGYYGDIWDHPAEPVQLLIDLGLVTPHKVSRGVTWFPGGGPHAQAMQLEHSEALLLVRVWNIALRMDHHSEYTPALEMELRAVIGDAAYSAGALPGPWPSWSVPRSR